MRQAEPKRARGYFIVSDTGNEAKGEAAEKAWEHPAVN
jgi:hypothetical protein